MFPWSQVFLNHCPLEIRQKYAFRDHLIKLADLSLYTHQSLNAHILQVCWGSGLKRFWLMFLDLVGFFTQFWTGLVLQKHDHARRMINVPKRHQMLLQLHWIAAPIHHYIHGEKILDQSFTERTPHHDTTRVFNCCGVACMIVQHATGPLHHFGTTTPQLACIYI